MNKFKNRGYEIVGIIELIHAPGIKVIFAKKI
jgi:hypothetical protein